MPNSHQRHRTAGHDAILRLLGALDDAKLAAIEAKGAERLSLSGGVAGVYKVLTADEADDEERA